MDCHEVRELMSAFHDGEAPADVRAAVSDHLGRCVACAEELDGFERLTAMSLALPDPQPPLDLWDRLEPWLRPAVSRSPAGRRRFVASLVAVAAVVLLTAGLGTWAYRTWLAPRSAHHVAMNFDRYLGALEGDPENAQRILLAAYGGRRVDADEAARRVHYRPAVANGLPDGYRLDAMYVLDMPCCTCVQAVCRGPGGGEVVIFEHSEDQPVWFGDRPRITANFCGNPTCIVQVDQRVAASWNSGGRRITVVGARDLKEVEQLAAHLGGGV